MGIKRGLVLLACLIVVMGSGQAGIVTAAADENEQGGALDGLAVPSHYILLLPPDDDARVPGTFQVIELIQLRNPSADAVEGAIIPLFAGAYDLELWAGFHDTEVQVSPEAIRATTTIAGGETQTFGVAYKLPTAGIPTALVRAVAHPTERLLVLLPTGSTLEPLAEGLSPAGSDRFAGRDVAVYAVEAVSPVQEWVLGLRDRTGVAGLAGVPVVDRRSTDGKGAWLLVMSVLGLAAIGAGASSAINWWQQRRFPVPGEPPVWSDPFGDDLALDREQIAGELLRTLADLEQARASGKCSESVYRRQRRRLEQAWKRLHLSGQDLRQA